MTIHRAFIIIVLAVLAAGCGNRPPVIDRVSVEPDSIPRGGVAFLRVRAEDPEHSLMTFKWQAAHGLVEPDTGDSAVYYAPDEDARDTVTVTVTDEQGLATVGSVVIEVHEGLCGGSPEVLIATRASLIVADSARVYYVETQSGGADIRWVDVDGFDYDTLVRRPHDIRRLADGGTQVVWLERDDSGTEPVLRVMAVGKADSTGSEQLVAFNGRSAAVTDIAVSASQLHVAWLETVEDTEYVARVTSYPRAGGAGQERFALAGPLAEATLVSRLAADGSDLFFLVTSNDPDRVAVMKLPGGSNVAQTLAGPGDLAPGTLAPGDRLAVAGDDVFWSEAVQGRVGRVGRDGTSPGFVVPAGGDAAGVSLVLAAIGYGNSGGRLFWAVPGDLRGKIMPSGGVLFDLDRGSGTISGMTRNGLHLFYVRDDGGGSRMYRRLIP